MTLVWAIECDGQTLIAQTHGDDLAAEAISADRAHQIDRLPEAYEHFDWDTLTLVVDLARLDAHLIASIDAERSRRSRPIIDPDETRRWEYQRKGAEALNDVGPWPWLEDLAYRKGTDVETERLDVLTAMDSAERLLRAISSTALDAKRRIRTATAAADKLDIFNIIDWPTEETVNG